MTDSSILKYFHSQEWAYALSEYLRTQRKLRCLRYKDICQGLHNQFNIKISERNLAQRFNSGRLGAQLFVCSLLVMEIEDAAIKEIKDLYQKAVCDQNG